MAGAAIIARMNFLAHATLSAESPAAIAGAIMGDFVKGPLPAADADAIARAVRLHRMIDSYTDAHPVVVAARGRISRERRRFAGILLDIFFDHFLAAGFRAYAGRELAPFAAEVYAALYAHWADLPPGLQGIVPYMAGMDWLCAYRERRGVDWAIRGIARRRLGPRGIMLADGIEELDRECAALAQDFAIFFKDLREYVVRAKGEIGITPITPENHFDTPRSAQR